VHPPPTLPPKVTRTVRFWGGDDVVPVIARATESTHPGCVSVATRASIVSERGTPTNTHTHHEQPLVAPQLGQA
jgi:hypothetical protein